MTEIEIILVVSSAFQWIAIFILFRRKPENKTEVIKSDSSVIIEYHKDGGISWKDKDGNIINSRPGK